MKNTKRVSQSQAVSIAVVLVVAAVALLASSVPALAQPEIVVRSSGGSDELIPPPSPDCDDLVFVTEVSFDELGNPIDIPRFGTIGDMVLSYVVPDFSVGPGIVELNEVITYDGHIGRRDLDPQFQEQVRFRFMLDGEIQAESPLTPDVPDGQRTGWIDVDMGSYELPNGADQLVIVHSGDASTANSVVVSALCGRLIPVAPPTTVPPTTVPATIVPPTTAPATTVPVTTPPPETVPPTTVSPTPSSSEAPQEPAPTTTVAPSPSSTDAPQEPSPSTTQPALAITGTESGDFGAVAGILILLGLLMVFVASKRSE